MSNTSYGTDRYVGCGSGIFRAGEDEQASKQARSLPTIFGHVTRYAPFHDPMKSVAVLPQTVVVPAGIPSLEP